GRGTVLKQGSDVVMIATGPVLVSQAVEAAALLEGRGMSIGVIALPWLRGIDGGWLAEAAGDAVVVTLDNHYLTGGQGDAVLAALSAVARGRVVRIGIVDVPRCGRNDEVLRAHQLDGSGIAEQVLEQLARVAP